MQINFSLRLVKAMSLVIALFLCLSPVFSQEPYRGLPKVIPPSPTAASLGKYGDVPVSLFSGLPNISVPLYDLISKELSVSVGLSYHAAGVKVEDVASWVGNGWSLNAGGAITRSIRGMPDENAGRLVYGVPDSPEEMSNVMLVRTYAINQRDAEPDVYFYNFNGRSGQLMFDESATFYSTGAEKIKFEKTLSTAPSSTWILVDEMGTRYLFGSATDGVEFTSSAGAEANITAWYLTKIVSADLSDTISFKYVDKSESYYRPNAETFIWHNNPGNFTESFQTGYQGTYRTATTTTGKALLSEISCKRGKIVFTTTSTRQDIAGGTELDKIRVYDKQGALRRTYQFTYSSVGTRLYLESVQEVGAAGELKPPYSFKYNDRAALPDPSSKAQDFWGYYNGHTSNQSLIPNLPPTFIITDNNGSQLPSGFSYGTRTATEISCKKGVLDKIIYPTGGSTEFDYEIHRFINGVSNFSSPTSIERFAYNGSEILSNSFTLQSKNVNVEIRFNDYREPLNYTRPFVVIQELVNGSWVDVLGMRWQVPYPSLNNTNISQNVSLQTNRTYRLKLSNEGCQTPCATPPAEAYSTYAKLSYFSGGSSSNITQGGGLRVKEIRDYTAVGGSPTNVRKFEYDSGLLVTFPIHAYSFYKRLCTNNFQNCSVIAEFIAYSISSQSLVNLGTSQGGHVVYRRVREMAGAAGENGYVDNIFHTPRLSFQTTYTPPLPPFVPPENFDQRQGKLFKQITYNAAGEKLEEVKHTYKTVSSGINYHTIQGLRILQTYYPSYFENPYPNGIYTLGQYNVTSRWVYQDSIVHTSYHKNNNSYYPVSRVIIQSYENPNHIQLTKSLSRDSEGNLLENKFWYPQDYGSVDNIATLISKNIIGAVLKQESHRNGYITAGKISRLNNDGKPYEIYQLESNAPVPSSAHNANVIIPAGYSLKATVGYDVDKNVASIVPTDNLRTIYIWGHNSIFPIAKVENISPSSTAASTSFEWKSNGAWSFAGPVYNDIPAKTGKYYYKLGGGNITKSVSAGIYKLEYWAKSAVTISGVTVTSSREWTPDANGWTLYEKTISATSPSTLTLSGTVTTLIDELRLYPSTAQITTYSYDLLNGMISVTEPNNKISTIEYDSFGRLRLARDHNGHITKTHDYHYKGF